MHTYLINDLNEITTATGEEVRCNLDLAEDMVATFDWTKLGNDWAAFALGAVAVKLTNQREEYEVGTTEWDFGKYLTDMFAARLESFGESKDACSGTLNAYLKWMDAAVENRNEGFAVRIQNEVRWTLAELLGRLGRVNFDDFEKHVRSKGTAVVELAKFPPMGISANCNWMG